MAVAKKKKNRLTKMIQESIWQPVRLQTNNFLSQTLLQATCNDFMLDYFVHF